MNMVVVNSSLVRAIGYDRHTTTLRIELVSGSSYDYYEVPQSVYEKMMRSPSKGEYLNETIKPNYKFELVEESVR